jgi:hypothetical protein
MINKLSRPEGRLFYGWKAEKGEREAPAVNVFSMLTQKTWFLGEHQDYLLVPNANLA